jgi:hypothetical protein
MIVYYVLRTQSPKLVHDLLYMGIILVYPRIRTSKREYKFDWEVMTQRHRDAGKVALIRLRPGPIEDSEASGEPVARNHSPEAGTRRVGGVNPADAQPPTQRRVSLFTPSPSHTFPVTPRFQAECSVCLSSINLPLILDLTVTLTRPHHQHLFTLK